MNIIAALVGDRAYDSDPLDEELRRDGIEMIAPHRANRSKSPTQDRRRLTRYRGGAGYSGHGALVVIQKTQHKHAGFPFIPAAKLVHDNEFRTENEPFYRTLSKGCSK